MGKRHPISLDVRMRMARRNGSGTTVKFHEVATVCRALDLLRQAEKAPRYRHKKRKAVVHVLGYASLQAAEPVPEGKVLTVYQHAEDGTWWARPHDEFDDGRFERLDT